MSGGEGEEGIEPLELSSSTHAALQAFLQEQAAQEDAGKTDPFAENWGLSQFWYTQETANTVAKEICEACPGGRVACIACPSLFREFKRSFPNVDCTLFEFDSRFEVLGNFALYDYNEPLDIREDLMQAFEVVVADPPYLSEECLTKTLQSVELLKKDPKDSFVYLLTGAVMRNVALNVGKLRAVAFRPQHSSKLANEFLLYTNQKPSPRLGGWDITAQE
ncbi:hypothetical protein BSKO_06810 [Bryopsis sp. KO-2023]|nr:hypothetical protein BSKO_06810 [Bryopsis sp. KO-2023]